MAVNRSTHGLRDSMFDLLDALRDGKVSLSQARMQVEVAKAICLTVVCERHELDILQRQIALDDKMTARSRVIEHDAQG